MEKTGFFVSCREKPTSIQATMNISAGHLAVALRVQEASDSLSAGDVRSRLSDAIGDEYRGSGKFAFYVDHFGDAESGDVIYSCDSDVMRAGYALTDTAGAAKCVIDFAAAVDVVPRTVYEPEAEEEDHYAAMEESHKAAGLYVGLPLYERFIAKAERDKATADDFAGKGRSFPILKPEDVSAAAKSIGRAGTGNLGATGIKKRIIAIAKRKGWTKQLPQSWQTANAESGAPAVSESSAYGFVLVESAATVEEIRLVEARSDYEIKLIAPGKGASAYYPEEVLKRDGPQVFRAGTHVYLNHPTAAEEASRPEGDMRNLAGVLTGPAIYHEAHAKGPGLYGRMKVFADHAQLVEEKAAHVGMSIRASGLAESGKLRDGVPVLAKLTAAQSVDVVTRAGAGGMILTESAKPAQSKQEGDGMTEAEAKQLIEAAVQPFRTRAIQADARDEAARLLESVSLPAAAKRRIIERATAAAPELNGALDAAKLREAVVAEASAEGRYLAEVTGSGRVVGMGVAPTAQLSVEEAARRREDQARAETDIVEAFRELGLDDQAAKLAANGRAA